ncbi:MAG: pseudouridine synthase [Roseburia sp.]|nr:pseudouridine synthase [Roseburia sp.]MCM1096460.1 pseudouridine synthase [Ruminococcus flavefaciens]
MESMRLNKFLAGSGVCSRREADRLIEQGRVSVNGEIAGIGRSVTAEDEIRVGGRLVSGRERTVVLAFYKPVSVTCTERDAHAEKILSDLIRYPVRVTYAGRLDKDSEGLLLLSNDGDLIQGMMKGSNRHEKEYLVRVEKEITDDFLRKISGGVPLKELDLTTRPCHVEKIGKYTFQIILTQGVNRQIRRMCQACGYRVKSLKRIRVMGITLGKLKPGEYRELTAEEIRGLYQDCGLSAKI